MDSFESLLRNLDAAFSATAPRLGMTLLEADFLDSWGFYPYQAKERCFSSKSNLDDFFHEVESRLEIWPVDDLNSLATSIKSGTPIAEPNNWKEVSANYLSIHNCGFYYLPPESFKYYLPAWMLHRMNKSFDELGVVDNISDRFFSWMREPRSIFPEWEASLTMPMKHCIARFLILMAWDRGEGFELFLGLLKEGWSKYDEQGLADLEKHLEELFIRDFTESFR